MREIKFRAWDKRRKWMLYDGDSCGYVEYDNHDVDVINLLLSGDNDENLTFLQYTGLCDKNGMEIYEGDIVEGISYSGHKTENQVTFLNGCYMFGNWNAHEFFNRHQYIEVIGNIYENPKLLEEPK